MRMLTTLLVSTSLLGACQGEYNIGQPPNAFGEPNPPSLESPINTDRVVQVTTPAVDVLWVVDNSGSMSDNQTALAENFPSFMNYFLGSGLDYHIGVVSTDMDSPLHQGQLREAGGHRYITPETPDAMSMFASMAQIGSSGSGTEKGRDAAYAAFEIRSADNDGFLRHDDESGIHIVVISDEDDQSTQISKNEYIQYLNLLRPEDELVTFNSIVTPPGAGFFGYPGVNYIDVTNEVGGMMRDIRSGEWSDMLEALGIQAAGLKSEYFLSELPVVDSIEVWVVDEGNVLPFTPEVDYTYDARRNSIRFSEFVPNPLSEVFIEYTVLASVVD